MEEKKKPTLWNFVKKRPLLVVFAPLVASGFIWGTAHGFPSAAWHVAFSVICAGVIIGLGMMIRNEWLLFTGKLTTDTTKYEKDGSIHTANVMDKGQDQGKFRDKWGNRLFTAEQMVAFADACEFHSYTATQGNLNLWVQAKKIP